MDGKENKNNEGRVLKQRILSLDIDWMDDNSSIKSQLNKHAMSINSIDPVAVVELGKLPSRIELRTVIADHIQKTGGSLVTREGVQFSFDKAGINSIVRHATGNEEFAAAMASPYVTKYGVLIAGQKNHKGRGNVTITYAAPVIINETSVHVGVVVMFTPNGRPHALSVGCHDGEVFKVGIKEAPKGTNSRVYRFDKGTALSTVSATTDNLSQK